MDLTDAIRGRRSATRLGEPAPADDEIAALLADAATGPDHGRLRPWRLVLVRGAARDALGAAFAAGEPVGEARRRAAGKPLRAPLLVSIVLMPRENPKVPAWEQLAATVAMVQNLTLLLHGRGWGVMWRTGPPARSAVVRALLGVRAGEELLGWLYLGTPDPDRAPPPRPRFDVRGSLSALLPDGRTAPLFAGAAVEGG